MIIKVTFLNQKEPIILNVNDDFPNFPYKEQIKIIDKECGADWDEWEVDRGY